MDSTFLQASEAAIERWAVPALVVESRVGGEREGFALNCDRGDRFRIASITKPMTAALAVQLLDLDEPTGIWPDEVRVRHLLSHTSGYAGEIGDLARFGEDDGALGRAVAELGSAHRPVGVEDAWSYANTGFWLAGWLAAEAAGTTYEDALAERVLHPAGMAATDFGEPSLVGTGPWAGGGSYPRARRPSGGLAATAADVGRFADWLLSEPWTAVMRVPLAETPSGQYGLGLFGEHVGGCAVWGHSGSYGGFQSMLLIVPERDAWFVGLTNSGYGKQALREIEDAWLERAVGARRPVLPTVETTAAQFAGTYRNEDGEVTFTPGGEGLDLLRVDGEGELHATARPIGATTFEIVGGPATRDRFDFPLPAFTRYGSRIAQRAA